MPPREPIWRPAALASSVSGRTPMARMTRSAGKLAPLSATTIKRPSAPSSMRASPSPRWSCTPFAIRCSVSGTATSGSSGGMTCGSFSRTVTESPRWIRFSTISKPINPPPTTTAVLARRSAIQERIRRESGMLRTAKTPGRSTPGSCGRIGAAPGDMTNASYRSVRLLPVRRSRTLPVPPPVNQRLGVRCTSFAVRGTSRATRPTTFAHRQ